MFESRDGKKLVKGMLVGIHFNAKRQDYSVVEMKSLKTAGKVIGYIQKGVVKNGYTVIGKSGQNSVRETNQKNRHAFLVGYWEGFELSDSFDGKVYYNAKKLDTFIDFDLYHKKNEIKEINSTESFQFEILEIDGIKKPLVKYTL